MSVAALTIATTSTVLLISSLSRVEILTKLYYSRCRDMIVVIIIMMIMMMMIVVMMVMIVVIMIMIIMMMI